WSHNDHWTFCFFSPRITSQHLSLEIGRRSSIHTTSPTEYLLASSWAWYFFERRIVFFIVGCVKRRSTPPTTVLSCLSLTTTPWSVRFGISNPLFLLLCLGARLLLRNGFRFGRFGRLCGRQHVVSFRRQLRRTGTLLRRYGLHARNVASDCPHARGVLELTGGPGDGRGNLLFLLLVYLVIGLLGRFGSCVGGFHAVPGRSVR